MMNVTKKLVSGSVCCLMLCGPCFADDSWLPQARPEPTWPAKQKELGCGIWWADYTAVPDLYQAPTSGDLARKGLARTVAGECEPLLLCLRSAAEKQPDPGVSTVVIDSVICPLTVEIRRIEFSTRRVRIRSRKKVHTVGVPMFLPKRSAGALRTRQNLIFWLTVRAPKSAQPGTYKGVVKLSIYSGLDSSSHPPRTVEVPFDVEILDVQLDPADAAFGAYYAEHRLPAMYSSGKYLQMYYEDMAAHGMNSVTAWGPGAGIDSSGEPMTPLKNAMSRMIKAGLVRRDIPVIFGFAQELVADRATAQTIAANFKRRTRQLGWPEMLVYGPDEPSGGEASLGLYEHVRPIIRRATAFSGHHVDKVGRYFDVWIVHVNPQIDDRLRRLARERKAEIWSYDCARRGTNPPYARLYAGLYTWAHELKGNFIWAYTHGHQWFWEGNRDVGHGYVIPSASGPVPMVGWELRREGVEDYRYLRTLDRLIRENPAAAAAINARRHLEQLRSRIRKEEPWARTPKTGSHWDTADLLNAFPAIGPTEFHAIRDRLVDLIRGFDPRR